MKKRILENSRLEIYNDWVKNKLNNDEIRDLNLLSDDEKYDAFYKDLEFGTGGIRAVIGVGTNRLNRITVNKFAVSYSLFLKKHYKGTIKIVIGYDTRLYSKEFSEIITSILLSENIKVYTFEKYIPTPILSFAVKRLGCIGGINITASHNPFYYNGIKVYNGSGGQILEREAKEISDLMKNAVEAEIKNRENAEIIDEQIIDNYFENVKKIDNSYPFINNTKLIYSPLHGSCISYCNKLLDRLQVNSFIVPSQNKPDPFFRSVKVPNPENIETFKEGLRYLKEYDADIIAVSDPDGDRLGVVVCSNNDYYHLNGNELGALIIYYLCEINDYTNGFIVSSIVTNNLGKNIAFDNNIKYFQTLTGFKYINHKINELNKNNELLLGYEESNGYLLKNITGDKDSFQALIILINMVSYYKKRNISLITLLDNIYKKYGYYVDKQLVLNINNININNIDIEKINETIKSSRLYQLKGCYDYKNLIYYDYILNNKKIILDFPNANVLKYILDDNSFIAVRPSGTEPKVKIYISYVSKTKEEGLKKVKEIEKEILNIIGEG